nr:MAG TPA: Lethal factor [Caudoviricetes sp.]
MGGRGSFSVTHGGVVTSSGGAGSLYISSSVETRQDIRKMFIDELGFKELYGTNELSTAQLGALGIQLKKLEREYGTISDGKTYLSVTNKPGVLGAAMQMKDGSKVMFINPGEHENVGAYKRTLSNSQKSGFKTRTDGKATSQYSYTVRHEYGHLTQYNLRNGATDKAADDGDARMRAEIRGIAKARYGARSDNPSGYGSTNRREFFAESFASMTGGNPNAYGKAMRDWFKMRK